MKPKFKIGDKVWFIYDNRIYSSHVYGLHSWYIGTFVYADQEQVDPKDIMTEYIVVVAGYKKQLDEKLVFVSKDELIEHLLENAN